MVVDRRVKPSHGYRAVHVIASVSDKLVEIQIRSEVQHLWAELSEKRSDVSPGIKYGHGDRKVLDWLEDVSGLVSSLEDAELQVAKLPEGAEKRVFVGQVAEERANLKRVLQRMQRASWLTGRGESL